ncbi:unnamed protein product [Rangifer tarandus platyrhynchus]|uniref:Uncharacterized protein n=2 Tax=Rangifer tarandus platyrhynchus TaxID=3082113 RepID=A0ABN8XVN6_RANTA|nr:unnamed protein product [Rangifer tarandus platyrhynchus]
MDMNGNIKIHTSPLNKLSYLYNPRGKHFGFYLERISDLLYGLPLSSVPDKTLTREALNTAQQLLPRLLSSCRQHLSTQELECFLQRHQLPQSWGRLLGLKPQHEEASFLPGQ